MNSEDNCLTSEQFAKLINLRFLKINQANLCGDFDYILSEVRWLHWNRCPANCKAKTLHLDKLVILDLTWSDVSENWEGWNHIKVYSIATPFPIMFYAVPTSQFHILHFLLSYSEVEEVESSKSLSLPSLDKNS